ncbi:hypothetical protein [Kitasatospora sp. NPDC094015]|uniref:hypothetical protein n=1 Tax=Kitasatospora sp. NPDC094015 TaxID=3155205 RepID=UPI0033237701
MQRRATALVLAPTATALTALALTATALTAACAAPDRRPVTVTAVPPAANVTTATTAPPADLWGAASALGDQGRGAFADVWSALSLDGARNRVLLYATDADRARQLVAAARLAHPETARIPVDVTVCAYSARQELAAAERVMAAGAAGRIGLEVLGATPTADGSGILVHATAETLGSPEFARQVRAAAGDVPARLMEGPRAVPGEGPR